MTLRPLLEKLVCACCFVISTTIVTGQTDTTYLYINGAGNQTSADSATSYRLRFKSGEIWQELQYNKKDNRLQSQGSYSDAAYKLRHGIWTWYNEKGIVVERSVYHSNDKREHDLFYENGEKRMHAVLNNDSLISVTGWDEQGNNIPGFIYQQEAAFPGGSRQWKAYLAQAVTKDEPKAYKRGKIWGSVEVQFRISKEGDVEEVFVSASSGHPDLDEHAMNVIAGSPRWIPAIQYNRKVIFRQRQKLTFLRVE